MADEFRGKVTSYLIMSFLYHFSGEMSPEHFSCYTSMCPSFLSSQILLHTAAWLICRPQSLCCAEKPPRLCVPWGMEPGPSLVAPQPCLLGHPRRPGCLPTSSLLSIMRSPLLESPCFSLHPNCAALAKG